MVPMRVEGPTIKLLFEACSYLEIIFISPLMDALHLLKKSITSSIKECEMIRQLLFEWYGRISF